MKIHFQQLVSGLMAMHKMCIVHRDLKCENVLLDRNNRIKIAGMLINLTISILNVSPSQTYLSI